VATLAAFGTFAVGFLARPLGGLFFGRRGDLAGRKSTLLITLTVMGLSTILIGLLPGAATIGVFAPLLLVLLRLVQGFAVGGEWGGSMIIVLESAPPERRGFFSAWPNTGDFSAQILITGVFAWVYTLPQDQLLSWGWRVPFLLSAVILVVTFWMRRTLHESPVFTDAVAPVRPAVKQRGTIRATFVDDRRNLLLIIGLRFAEALPYFLLTVFALSYGSTALGIDKSVLNTAILIASVLAFVAHGVFATISDRVGRRPVYFFGAAVVFVMAFPFFGMLQSGSFLLITLGYVLVLNVGHNAINAIQPAFFAELFPPLHGGRGGPRDRVDPGGRAHPVHRDGAGRTGRHALAARRRLRDGRSTDHDGVGLEGARDVPPRPPGDVGDTGRRKGGRPRQPQTDVSSAAR